MEYIIKEQTNINYNDFCIDKIQENIKNFLECTICTNLMIDPMVLKCGHTICLPCIIPIPIKNGQNKKKFYWNSIIALVH